MSHPIHVVGRAVGRASETQLQVRENLDGITEEVKG